MILGNENLKIISLSLHVLPIKASLVMVVFVLSASATALAPSSPILVCVIMRYEKGEEKMNFMRCRIA